ncbi:MAG: polyphosphate polymerase domain-containing protein, partial [Clostridia bacterium]|nr:polyphosphate polymerase domain-containing protein [Clostridia bacterium]
MTKQRWRHELKYLINLPDWALLRSRFPAVLKPDPYAGEDAEYWIRSLYFDDYWNTAYEEKDAGVLTRRKYRIRIYNCSDERIVLERKNKYGPYIWKQSAPLTRRQADAILGGDYSVLLEGEVPLL